MTSDHTYNLNEYGLICLECSSKLEFNSKKEGVSCTNKDCKKPYKLIDGVPSILTKGFEMKEGEGFYEKILGGTMEDGVQNAFVKYDTQIRVSILKKFLQSADKEGELLDVCCSKAPFYNYLSKLGFKNKVFGVDLLLNQLQVAKSRGVKTVHANALKIPFPEKKFSTVIFSEALVHLMQPKDQKRVFEEIHRVMKADGTLLITVSNFRAAALHSFLKDTDLIKSEHCTYYTTEDIKRLVENKFEIQKVKTFAYYYLLPNFLRKSAFAMKAFDFAMSIFPSLGMVSFIKLTKISK